MRSTKAEVSPWVKEEQKTYENFEGSLEKEKYVRVGQNKCVDELLWRLFCAYVLGMEPKHVKKVARHDENEVLVSSYGSEKI